MYRPAPVLVVALILLCCAKLSEGQGCESDVMLILDGSSTVGFTNFNNLKVAVEIFINNTFTDHPNVRIGFMVFSSNVETPQGLTNAANQNNLISNLRAASFPNNARNTHLAINEARTNLVNNARVASPRDLILVTIGLATDGPQAVTAANNARAEGITIYALGVESDLIANPPQLNAYRQQLQQIATSRVTALNDYSTISNVLGNMPNTICQVLITGNVNGDTVFTTETIILTATLNQGGITSGVWRKNGVTILADPRFSITRENRFQRLTIVNAQLSDSGSYTYTVSGQTTAATVTVNAGVIFYTRRVTSYRTQTVDISATLVNANCNQNGVWQKSNTALNLVGRFSYVISSDCRIHTLRITNAVTSDSGAYEFLYNGQVVETLLTITATSVPINGGFGQWTSWTEFQCSVTCGTSATKTITRTRECNTPFPQNGGANCTSEFSQVAIINCGLIGCPVNGGISQWEQWNSASVSCPQTCGTNAVKTTERRRTCTVPRPQNGGIFCPESLFETRIESCGLTNQCPTPVNGGVSLWGLWTNPGCSVTCGVSATKTIQRFRTCTNPAPSPGGNDCQENLVEQAVINCGLIGCPVNGGVSQWEAWNSATAPCPLTCGISVTKIIQRIRRCNNPTPQNGGAACTENLVESSTTTCSVPPCTGAVNGGVGQWTSWNTASVACPVTCGINALKFITRTRPCNNPPPSGGGRDCLDHLTENTQVNCGLIGCPVNGGVSEWEAWNSNQVTCPLTCGVNATKQVERIRRCNNPVPSNGGLPCSQNLIDTAFVFCNTPACAVPINGGVSQWGAWADPGCGSVTCGNAFKNITRIRSCNNPVPANGGIFCTQPLSEISTVSCGLLGCPVNGGVGLWGQWSAADCTLTCGQGVTGRSQRTRSCNNPVPSNGGAFCPQSLTDTTFRSCGLPACPQPIDGGVSQWAEWSIIPCPVSCGEFAAKNITRIRFCNNPFPSNGGRSCQEIGLFLSQTIEVNCGLLGCPVNGGVSLWGAWSIPGCPATCGLSEVRTIRRTRTCTNPSPQNGGITCQQSLDDTALRSCELPACPGPVDGGFNQWSTWTQPNCPWTCGATRQTVQSRFRLCNNPVPRNGGQDCSGDRFETQFVSCGLQNCPVNGGLSLWSQWSVAGCGVTCGQSAITTATRFRTCNNPPPSNGGLDCTFLGATSQTETRSCNLNPCPINGGLSQWNQWTVQTCQRTCGSTLTTTATRVRLCNNPTPQFGGRDCSLLGSLSDSETRSCGLPSCPINGGLSPWSQWNVASCSATCGTSVITSASRFRTCTNPPPTDGGSDCTGLGATTETETRSCNLNSCPINGGLSQWSQWNIATCLVTCGINEVTSASRFRTCTNPSPQFGGRDCTGLGSTSQTESRSCFLNNCPINGGLSQWSQWNVPSCQRTCGSTLTVTATRIRFCDNPVPQFGGRNCTGLGNLVERQDRNCGLPSCPINGGLSQWSQWSVAACTATCGTSVITSASRFRTCTNPPPTDGGLDCTGLGATTETETRSCNLNPCPINGGLSPWSQWNVVGCVVTCGVNEVTSASRFRTCTNPSPQFGGRDCTGLGSTSQTETRSCFLNNCPINGGLSQWSQWNVPSCQRTCGSTFTVTATRVRFCDNPVPQFGGRNCTGLGNLIDSQDRNCGLPSCPINGGLSQWSQWSVAACTATCGTSVITSASRFRTCTNPPPTDGGSDCTGLGATTETETRSCNLNPCPINGGLSFWSQWNIASCAATCGSSEVTSGTRSRTCTNPTPQFGGRDCTGLGLIFQSQSRSCNFNNCPINGGFTEWTPWNFPNCAVTCGSSETRTVTRRRTCTNPSPQFGGRQCVGNEVESYNENCGLPSCARDGGISQWTAWVNPQCVITCGTTATYIAYRQRFCNNPSPRDGGRNCTESRWGTEIRNCGLPACPINGGLSQWTQWTGLPCAATCGLSQTRVVNRIRFCNSPTPAFGGLNCTASRTQQDVRNCQLTACPIDGGIGQWSQWAGPPCSRTCGSSITRTVSRARFCNTPYPQNGGRGCTESTFEEITRSCGLPVCRVDGGFNQWSQWNLSPCSQTCGVGVTTAGTRFRTCTNPIPTDGGFNCTGDFIQNTIRGCNLNPCPINGGLTQWSQWSVPQCVLTCGTNRFVTAHRLRSCTDPAPRFGGLNCTGSRDETESRSCNLGPCAVDGGLTQWSGWAGTPCTRTCGTTAYRTVTRTRSCINPSPANGGVGCTGSVFESETRSCGFESCPIDGGISQWTTWSDQPCSITCGPSAVKVVVRTRVCNTPLPQFGGRTCNESGFEYDVRSCGLGNCPVNGGLTQWTQWSNPECPVTCGPRPTKTVFRTRACTNPAPQFGGRDCNQPLNETTTVLCGVPACPVHGGLTPWSQWNNPLCPVTCGTAATKEVVRTRTCTNPVPRNGGDPCTGDEREVEVRSCNLPRCPIRIIGLCASAQRVNGVGYRYHPTDCDKYIQCYYNPNGYIIGAYRSCPFGYYWDQRTLRCDHPWKVNCPMEKCDGSCVANYNLEGSCRAHWVCQNGISRADCCPMGFRYVVGQGCKPDFYCRDTCPTPCASRDVCDKRPDWDDNPLSYNISVGLLGWMRASCVSGTYFDLLDCGCGIPSNSSCRPDYSIDFNDNNALTAAQSSWMSMTDISILNGYARFNGQGHMFVNVSQKAPAVDCPLIIRFRFTESQTVVGRRILASTSDCYKANTLVIAIDQNEVIFEMKSVFGQTFKMPISLAGFSSFEWKTVTLVYDGQMITGVVESANLKYMQWQFAPEINLMECGMRFGSDGSMSSAERFIGSLDSFSIYRCNPGGLY